MHKRLLMAAVALLMAAVVWAADGPLTPIAQLRGRTDGNGYLMVASGAVTGADGPLTPIGNLRGRTDANGYLRVALSGSSVGTFGDGTACTTPSMAFAAEATTGFLRPATGHIAVDTAGTCSTSLTTSGLYVKNDSFIGFGNSGNTATGAADTVLVRVAANQMALRNGANAQTFQVGPSTGAVTLQSAALITQGSATGLTINDAGNVRDLWYKATIASTAFVCAAVTCDVTIGTLPADTHLSTVYAKLTTTFACAATCTTSTLSMVLGKGAGGSEYLASLDADAATATFGDADAELGTLLVRAAAINGGTYNSGSQAVVIRLTSGTGNIGTGAATNLSQGSITVYLRVAVFP